MLTLGDAAILPPATTSLRHEVRAFIADQQANLGFTPAIDSWMGAPSPEFTRALAERGWVGMTIPAEYGGHGRTPLERFVVTEELLAAGAPVAAHWIADRQMAPSILKNGTEAQKRRYLPGIAAGKVYFAIGMSEPDSGSDLASVSTRATAVDGGWRLNGTKVWTTGAHYAHAMIVLARTDPAGDRRQSGLSQFIVDLPHPGVEINPIYSIDGGHHFNEVVFTDTFIPENALLGARGQGWNQVTAELAFERSGPERFMSTFPLLCDWARHAGVANRELGRLAARAWTLRQMSISVATALSVGQNPDVQAAIVKDLGSRFEGDVAEAVQRETTDVEREGVLGSLLRDAIIATPAFTLRGGTNEILRSIVARGVGVR